MSRISNSRTGKTSVPRLISAPSVWAVDGLGGLNLVGLLDFGEQFAGAVGKLEKPYGWPRSSLSRPRLTISINPL